MLFKVTVLGDGGVGKTALTVQVSLSEDTLERVTVLTNSPVYNVVFRRGTLQSA